MKTTATIRDLRTQFPKIRRLLEQEGEVIVTDRGRPIMVLRPFQEHANQPSTPVDYYARLKRRMPKPLTKGARQELDEAARAER